ncbi:carbohydrate ABC transporter permease [Truepera radiovictrix]|uniref:Binding-protein-dependent transport systems inner membrane component n=1 Tax=Truepera radiovictrix (strain DSM 17093 / CIP 108686 / LMG 22925 / RQ-24) TaxID=649638 RepID=D7CVR4_TRURR|nr:carbohydrate ABC transporter permease [Truepera radiovictrix]ADI15975.1 binding-protein-dependent transport systems inner membrane component [Truepera radiovictrix DSM 17093]WMT58399.1 carbohydrate ABC transporter permease [Truepera radiovictrix]
MAQVRVLTQRRRPPAQDIERWQARRRWARVGIVYTVMLIFSILFLGPLLFAALSSLREDPLEYPPTLAIPQLNPRNWAAGAALGRAGANAPLWGGFAPGAQVPFEITYFVPQGAEPEVPTVTVPRRRPGGGLGAVQQIDFAADYAALTPTQELAREAGEFTVGGESVPGTFVTYGFTVTYEGDGPTVNRLPVDIEVPTRDQVFVSATLSPSRLERRGRVASFDNITPGSLGYVFNNYARVFEEARSITTGRSLFLSWTLNSFIIALAKVITTILFASMAGYALARLNFPGKNLIFILILFAQMIPGQVTFISNYLVLRDGIFGLSRLWGQATLLNSLSGVILSGLVGAGAVFIMKQFFETIPREVEEAAMIDGTSQWQRFSKVVLPMARPALGALTILTFQGAWNDFFWPLVVLTTPEDIKTLPIGLLTFRNIYGNVGDWGLILAGAVMSALPIIILFVVFQKYFLEGVSYGGGKE